MSAHDCPENLVARQRRGALSADEQAELTRLLQATPELRVAFELGGDFDRAAAVQAEDEQRVARIVAATLEARRPLVRHRFRIRRLGVLAAAAVLAVCGIALGVRAVWSPRSTVPKLAVPNAPVRAPNPSAARRSPPGEEPELVPTPALPAAVTPPSARPSDATQPGSRPSPSDRELGSRREAPAEPATSSVSAAADGAVGRPPAVAAFPMEAPAKPDAATLFRQANAARAAGEIDRAASSLEQLEREFPGSAEANVALVSLGKLRLLRGAPGAALDLFSRYLAAGGPLDEEALVGRAQALAALGRGSDERSTWQILLVRFPGSVYAGQARERLGLLGADTAE